MSKYLHKRGSDDYAFHEGKAEHAEVDTEHLKNVIPILDDLKSYIEDKLCKEVIAIGGGDCLGKDHTVPFGKFENATTAAQKHHTFLTTVHDSYTSISESLDTAIKATKEIIKNYDSVEELNTANAQAVSKAFADSGSKGSSDSTATSGEGY